VGVAPEGQELLKAIKALKEVPEMAVISVTVEHGMDGVSVVREIVKQKFGIKLIVSYTIESKMRLVEALKAGAVDRIRKPFEKDDLHNRLTKVHLLKGTGGGFFRNSIRLTKPLPITFAKPGFFSRKMDGRTLDISDSGCRIQSTGVFEKGTQLKIVLDVPGLGAIKVLGRVANAAHDKIHSTYDAGIVFIEISDKDKGKLERYIMDEAEKI